MVEERSGRKTATTRATAGATTKATRRAATLDRAFQALADPTRRRLLGRLQRGSRTVGELAAPIDMSLAAVSKHLRVLERAGLVRREVRGREHHLHLEAAPLRAVEDFAAEYRSFWEDRLDALGSHLEARSRRGPRVRGAKEKRG